MSRRWSAAILAGAIGCAVGCNDDVKAVAPPKNVGLPPVGAGGAGAGLPAAGSGLPAAGSGLPPAGSASTSADAGPGVDAGAGSGAVALSDAAPGGDAGPTTAAANPDGGGSIGGATTDCDVTFALHDTRVDWSGGATGSAPIEHGQVPAREIADAVAPLDDHYCRAVLRPDDTIRFATIVAAMKAVLAGRYLRLRIVDSGGAELWAMSPDSDTAGTAVRDAPVIVIGKADVRIGDQVAATIGDTDLATKVGTPLVGTRAVMAIIKVEADTPYKVLGPVLAAVKARGIDSVIFARK